jgi:NADPH:quinone reductase-like Zn-dependent oxidoreductase
LQVVTTASPHNFEYLKSLGADAVFDYNSPTVVADIKKFTNNKLKYAMDCIAEGKSPQITVDAMSEEGGLYTSLLSLTTEQIAKFNPAVEARSVLAYTIVGERFTLGTKEFPAKPEDEAFAKKFWKITKDLLAEGKVKAHKLSVNEYGSGLDGVLKGMEAMKEGKVSGEKLVFTL